MTDEASGASEQTRPATVPELATRGDRLLAVIVDVIVGMVVAIPLGMVTGLWSAAFHQQPVPPSVYAENVILGWVWFFVVNGYFLMKYGQTVGKRFLSIRIGDYRTGDVPPFWRLLVRIGVTWIAGLLGLPGRLFGLADVLFIFRNDRRCIHDWIAGTRVVKA